jgi:hypothetical protein
VFDGEAVRRLRRCLASVSFLGLCSVHLSLTALLSNADSKISSESQDPVSRRFGNEVLARRSRLDLTRERDPTGQRQQIPSTA